MPFEINAECAGATCTFRVLFMSVNAWLIEGEEHMILKSAAHRDVQMITGTKVCWTSKSKMPLELYQACSLEVSVVFKPSAHALSDAQCGIKSALR